MMKQIIILLCMNTIFCSTIPHETEWTYQGESGQDFWAAIKPEWQICNTGKRQSPVNIDTNKLLYDPNLGDLKVTSQNIDGILQNTGTSLEFKTTDDRVIFSGGPLSYNYQFERMVIHYGLLDASGSEHQVNDEYFSGEIQFYAYNKDLYRNASDAGDKPQGMVVIAVMVKIGEMTPNAESRLITSALTKVAYKGSSHRIKDLSITSLLPDTKEYFTYEGSLTQPSCSESVVWVLYNKPIYVTVQEMYAIRRLRQGTQDNPKEPLGNNFRRIQPSVVTVRTNINPKMGAHCSYTYTNKKSENAQTDKLVYVYTNHTE